MKKTWIDFVREGMAKRKLSQEELAAAVDKTQGGVGHWLNGRRQPNIDDIAKMLGVVGVDQVVLNSDGSLEKLSDSSENVLMPKARLVPVVGEILMEEDGTLTLEECDIGYLKAETIDPKAKAYRIKGSNAEPRIRNGEFIVIEPSFTAQDGDDVLVLYKNGKYSVKTLDHIRDNEYRFSSINLRERPISVPESEIEYAHPITGIYNRVRFVSKAQVESVKQE